MRVPSVGPEQQQAVKLGLDVGELGLSLREDPQEAAVFLQKQSRGEHEAGRHAWTGPDWTLIALIDTTRSRHRK